MALSCPLEITTFQEKDFLVLFIPYYKSFISQDGWILALYWSTPSRSINTQKKERGQYLAILTEQAWSITDTYFVQSRCVMKLPKRPGRSTSPFSFLASVGCRTRNLTRHMVHPQTAGMVLGEITTTTCTRRSDKYR